MTLSMLSDQGVVSTRRLGGKRETGRSVWPASASKAVCSEAADTANVSPDCRETSHAGPISRPFPSIPIPTQQRPRSRSDSCRGESMDRFPGDRNAERRRNDRPRWSGNSARKRPAGRVWSSKPPSGHTVRIYRHFSRPRTKRPFGDGSPLIATPPSGSGSPGHTNTPIA